MATKTKTPNKTVATPAAKVLIPAAPATDPKSLTTGADNSLFANDGGVGFDEGIDRGAYALPFLSILQGLSPMVQRGTPKFLEGAAPGRIVNTVTKDLFDEVAGSVVRRTHTFCFWTPRDKGGGFQGEVPADDVVQAQHDGIQPDDKGRRILKDGREITEHRNFYFQFVHEDGRQEMALISMAKSQLRNARQWNTNIALKSARGANGQPASTSEIWRLKTLITQNKKGDQYYIWDITHLGRHQDAIAYAQVREAVGFAKTQSVVLRQLEQEDLPTGDPGDGTDL